MTETPIRYAVEFSALRATPWNTAAIDAAVRRAGEFQPSGFLLDPNHPRGGTQIHEQIPMRGIVLLGPTGTGKSSLLGALALRVKTLGFSTTWISWVDLSVRLWSTDQESIRLSDRLSQAHVLVLDEIAQTRPTPHVEARLAALLEARYGNRRPTFATTNLLWPELEDVLGAAVAGRIRETCDLIELNGPSWRPHD